AKVYNIKGQLVRRLEVSEKTSDQYLYNWDCKDRNNRAVPAGVYLIRIKTNSGEISKKVTVIK
ncbi:MAG: FlgD immunoglobulin-like domain containing protein, partial [Candidatus Cloacimonadaceae bacterium]